MVSALIIPRSATMQTRPMEKRWRRRSTTGTRLPVSAVLPGHISVHTAIALEQHGENHLAQVRPMILGIAVPAERLPAGALEIQTGRIHEYEIELGEQVTPPLE